MIRGHQLHGMSPAARIKRATSDGTLRLGSTRSYFEHEQCPGEHQDIVHAAEQPDGDKRPPACEKGVS
jgi:hypothetical protein